MPTIPISSAGPVPAAAAFGFMNFEAGELGWHVATAYCLDLYRVIPDRGFSVTYLHFIMNLYSILVA